METCLRAWVTFKLLCSNSVLKDAEHTDGRTDSLVTDKADCLLGGFHSFLGAR